MAAGHYSWVGASFFSRFASVLDEYSIGCILMSCCILIKQIVDECSIRHCRQLVEHLLVRGRALVGLLAGILAVLLSSSQVPTVFGIVSAAHCRMSCCVARRRGRKSKRGGETRCISQGRNEVQLYRMVSSVI